MIPSYHEPVLVAEIVDALRVEAGKKYIDATLGGGGHTTEIVRRGGNLLGLDTDPEALEFARNRLEEAKAPIQGSWKLVAGNFRNLEEIAKEEGFGVADGVLFDLGVSSHQLDTKERGFSFRFTDAPFDLRLNQTEGELAAQLVNRVSEDELYEIIATFGEEERARAIAHALVRARSITPISTVGDVTEAIGSVGIRSKERHSVLARVFQAMRIAVNDELASLKAGLSGAAVVLKPGGRLAVVSFHSLEDRIVKRMLRGPEWKIVSPGPIVAGGDELERNPRARSAKLRVAQRL